jgi:uncharacterized protein (DUF58 family)
MLDWSVYGRSGKMFLRTFRHQREQRLLLVPDLSPSMRFGEPTKMAAALRLSAALGFLALRSGAAVRLALESAVHEFRGHARFAALLDACEVAYARAGVEHGFSLAGVVQSSSFAPSTSGSFSADAARLVAAAGSHASSIILSDFMEPAENAHALLAASPKPGALNLICVLSDEEREPALSGAFQLHDCESGARIALDAAPEAMRLYRVELDAHLAAWHAACERRTCAFIPAASGDPIDELILGHLQPAGVA